MLSIKQSVVSSRSEAIKPLKRMHLGCFAQVWKAGVITDNASLAKQVGLREWFMREKPAAETPRP